MTKTVIITGGSKGIGRSLTEGFAAAGYKVVVGARNDSGISEVDPDNIRFVQCDVQNEADHRRLLDAAMDWTGQLDVYINNAGFSAWRPISDIDGEFFDDMMAVNLKGAFFGCKIASEGLRKGGVIINISSLAGKRGTANNSMYVATKFGMNGMTQALAKELGPRGIRINALCPVLVRTPGLMEALAVEGSPAKGDPEAFLAGFAARDAALGFLPEGEDVAAMAVFLASEQARAISGQCINVDSGVLPG
ncbi:NAD(P)-dependent dehydrogenase (short-subunit alcohol dehydrogenase family) [Devosia sp. UYZn731]|uniref:SDR family NAD(P)-dependent oxidoreductase n=1 Tax=Devosia sp. UYZn731 TaxID=3156345 RepID=UPI003394B2C7